LFGVFWLACDVKLRARLYRAMGFTADFAPSSLLAAASDESDLSSATEGLRKRLL
jgi:hypothetical protein